MRKKLFAILMSIAMVFLLFTGCTDDSSSPFVAQDLVDRCQMFVKPEAYDANNTDGFCMDFVRNVLDEFGNSVYYANMTDDERFAALDQIMDILESYNYGSVNYGFVRNSSIDTINHTVSWKFTHSEYNGQWIMPGYDEGVTESVGE